MEKYTLKADATNEDKQAIKDSMGDGILGLIGFVIIWGSACVATMYLVMYPLIKETSQRPCNTQEKN